MNGTSNLFVTQDTSIRDVMTVLERNAKGIALVVEEDRRLLGTVTDGDIRRAILAGMNLDLRVRDLLEQRAATHPQRPLALAVGTPDVELLRTMNEYGVRQIPLLDEQHRVVDVAFMSSLVKEYELPLTAVVVAGGLGSRLQPLTDHTPKPMLPVGGRPLMHLIIDQLRGAGIRRVNVTTHYQNEKISEYFGDGQSFGVQLNYVTEDRPLGTAGGLGLLGPSDEPLLVINGDVLARVDFRAMLDHHREHGAQLTVAVRQHEMVVPYGVIDVDGARVQGVREKPALKVLVNAGIYVLEPEVTQLIPPGARFDMTHLIQRLLDEGRSVVSFPITGYWMDIGQMGDYAQVQQDVSSGRFPS